MSLCNGGARIGTWTVSSKKDKRFNKSGRAVGLVCAGGPDEMYDWIEKCVKKYKTRPDDIEISFWKD